MYVFNKYHATEVRVEIFADIESNVPRPSDVIKVNDGPDMEFLDMCNPKINLSQDDMMTERSSRSSDCKSGSSDQKRKHTCRHSRLITSFETTWTV